MSPKDRREVARIAEAAFQRDLCQALRVVPHHLLGTPDLMEKEVAMRRYTCRLFESPAKLGLVQLDTLGKFGE